MRFCFVFRYAGLRRRLLVDPHLRSNSGDLALDNPLSQNPGDLFSFCLVTD